VLVFDEMVTLTLSPGGAQQLLGVVPDLTAVGKVIGGGMGIGAVGGRRDIMALADPGASVAPVPTGTTFGGHPLAAAAGLAQLRMMEPKVYERLHELGARARAGVAAVAADTGAPLSATGLGHLFNLHWNEDPIVTYDDHCRCDAQHLAGIETFLRSQGYTFNKGVRCQISYAMDDADIDGFVDTIRVAVEEQA